MVDELRRVRVGVVVSFSSPYAMRVWLDPEKLSNFQLSPADALAAVQEQNTQTSGGALGEQPLAEGAELNATILTQNRFTAPEQFASVTLREPMSCRGCYRPRSSTGASTMRVTVPHSLYSEGWGRRTGGYVGLVLRRNASSPVLFQRPRTPPSYFR